ncbi:DUF805 domain-containing protein [Demequina sp. SO4-13]|uniref:DUF805 domain-containing protein n=1 Tax=Demequina sp. SO4-13 TaxID=3401027 RepID=UPI003AF9C3C4
MGFGQAIKSGFRQYAAFDGRATRAEFWLFFLFSVFIAAVGFGLAFIAALMTLQTADPETGDASLGGLAIHLVLLGLTALALLTLALPLCGVWARRLHDTGRSGHWLWLAVVGLGIVPLAMALADSERQTNRWGRDPKADEREGV